MTSMSLQFGRRVETLSAAQKCFKSQCVTSSLNTNRCSKQNRYRGRCADQRGQRTKQPAELLKTHMPRPNPPQPEFLGIALGNLYFNKAPQITLLVQVGELLLWGFFLASLFIEGCYFPKGLSLIIFSSYALCLDHLICFVTSTISEY